MNWFAIATVGRKERLAEARLVSVGFETLLPLEEVGRSIKPLFPGYLFSYADPIKLQQQLSYWKSLRVNTGIHKMVIAGKMDPVLIDSYEILELRGFLHPLTNIYEGDPVNTTKAGKLTDNPFKKGDIAHYRMGSATDLPLKVEEVRGTNLVDVITTFLSRSCSIKDVEVEELMSETEYLKMRGGY